MKVPFSKPAITEEEIQAVTKVLKSGWLTTGDITKQFEKKFAKYVGAEYAIAVNSCTSALFLSLKALGVGEGDEVVIPSLTFTATASVVVHCGAKPVFADVDKETLCLDPLLAFDAMTPHTKAIIPVHLTGNPASRIFREVALDPYVKVVVDSAHRITRKEVPADFTCYSFYATKNMTTGEGGMITTNNKDKADWLRQARLHGLETGAEDRYRGGKKWIYNVNFPGWKCNPTDISSAMGLVQLKKLPEMEEKRKKLIKRYNKALGYNRTGTHLYPILVDNRDKFMVKMREAGVGVSVHFLPLHLMPAYKDYKPPQPLPNTEFLGEHLVSLPLYPDMTEKEQEYVIDNVKKIGGLIK